MARQYISAITSVSSGNKANASAVATLANDGTNLWYVTGFACTASGATAGLPVNVTLTGLLGGTLTYTFNFPAGVLVGALPLTVSFDNPLAGLAPTTDVVLTLPASGAGGTNAAVVLHGFKGTRNLLD